MKTIIVAPNFLPSLSGGGPVVSISNLLSLISHDNSIELITRRKFHDDSGYVTDDKVSELSEIYKTKLIYSNFIFIDLLKTFIPLNIKSRYYLNSFFDVSTLFLIILSFLSFSKSEVIIAPRGELTDPAMKFSKIKKMSWLFLYNFLFKYKINIIYHFTSESELKSARSYVDVDKYYLIPNISNVSDVDSLSFLPKVSGQLKLITFSRISPKKNILDLVKLITTINITYPGISLDIYGFVEDVVYFNKLKPYFSKNINFKGTLDRDKLSSVLVSYHMFISLSGNENFGHSAVESMLIGLPVILSDGFPWNDVPEDAGIILNDYDLLSQKIDSFYFSSDLSKQRKSIKSYIQNKLNIDDLISSYKDMLLNSR